MHSAKFLYCSKSAELSPKRHARRHSSNDSMEEVTVLYRNLYRLSDPTPACGDAVTSTKLPSIEETPAPPLSPQQSNDSFEMPSILSMSPLSPIVMPTTPQRPSLGKTSDISGFVV
jgi:hypothetical protein